MHVFEGDERDLSKMSFYSKPVWDASLTLVLMRNHDNDLHSRQVVLQKGVHFDCKGHLLSEIHPNPVHHNENLRRHLYQIE